MRENRPYGSVGGWGLIAPRLPNPKWIGARSDRSDINALHSLFRFRLSRSVTSNSTRKDFEVEWLLGVGK